MGNQLCPGSAKDLIQELGEIQKGEKSYEVFFKSCFDFREHKLHEILISEAEEGPLLHRELPLDHPQPAFPHTHPLSPEKQHPNDAHPQVPPEDASADLQFEDGSRYKGRVREGLPHGEGEQTNAHGDHYRGEFREGVKEGRGAYRFANADHYEGEFREDAMWGQGIYRFANGDTYEGEFKRNQRYGQGTYTFGQKAERQLQAFEGEYRGDVREGGGRLKYDGFEMRGQWKNGLYEFGLDPNLLK